MRRLACLVKKPYKFQEFVGFLNSRLGLILVMALGTLQVLGIHMVLFSKPGINSQTRFKFRTLQMLKIYMALFCKLNINGQVNF